MNRSQRGFTLIELMVALVVSSLLVGMILAIFSRMSLAYRGQQQIAGVQQVLAAARATLEMDAKQAGLEMSQGFKIANIGPAVHTPVQVINNNTGPDQIAFFYADPTTQAATLVSPGWPTVIVDSNVGFALGDLVVLSSVDVATTPNSLFSAGDANFAVFNACVLQISLTAGSVAPGPPPTIRFSSVAPWGPPAVGNCPTPGPGTMLYKFVARAYKIDTSTVARAILGPLQQSQTGGLLGTAEDGWTDIAYGFTDIQTSLQAFHRTWTPGDTADPDSDVERDWYSGALQNSLTGTPSVLVPPDGLLQISISLVARTDRDIEGIATSATPLLTDPLNVNNNTIGDRPSVVLPSASDNALKGSRIYRFTTFQVDFRNLGVGR